jgi:hypothetical protein
MLQSPAKVTLRIFINYKFQHKICVNFWTLILATTKGMGNAYSSYFSRSMQRTTHILFTTIEMD